MIQKFFLSLILAFSLVEAKVSVYAHYFGQPEFVKYQHLLLKNNLLDEYEFTVFEDSNNKETSEQIQNECKKYGIKYVKIPPSEFVNPRLPLMDKYVSLNAPSFQCSIATQYIYDNYVTPSKDICLILDNDIFLISPFSVEKYLANRAFSYVRQDRVSANQHITYMLPNFLIFNPSIMPAKEELNFNMGAIQGINTDSGGYTHFYLCNHSALGSEIGVFYLYDTQSELKENFKDKCPLLFNSPNWLSHYFLEKETFLHIRMGSNWSNDPNYFKMKKDIEVLFDALLLQTHH